MTRTGVDDAQQTILDALAEVARLRSKLDGRERDLVKRGLALDVPVAFMSEALGMARTTLGMRLRTAAARTGEQR